MYMLAFLLTGGRQQAGTVSGLGAHAHRRIVESFAKTASIQDKEMEAPPKKLTPNVMQKAVEILTNGEELLTGCELFA